MRPELLKPDFSGALGSWGREIAGECGEFGGERHTQRPEPWQL